MTEVTSKGKYPKDPRRGNYLEICGIDFKNFKERDYSTIFSYLSTLVTDYEKRGLNPEPIKQQKANLENIKKLIESGNEKVAFQNFIRSFPACLPYRRNITKF